MQLTPTDNWQTLTPTKAETWFVEGSTVRISSNADANTRVGGPVSAGQSLPVAAGVPYWYKLETTGLSARIVRVQAAA